MNEFPYVLVTAARNEARYISTTIRSVTSQTRLPVRWIIVSDGSTDDTDGIVLDAAKEHSFIELIRTEPGSDRNFGSKAAAINAGYKQVAETHHELVGVLDADVSFGPDYYEQLIDRFQQDPKLGIGGGVLTDVIDGKLIPQVSDTAWSVSGPVQMFRKECFNAIGGYLPLRGGIDAAAEVMARMNGWHVRAFPELEVLHLRQTGRENHNRSGIFFHRGLEDYRLGYHPLFFAARSVRRFRERPFVVGGLIMLCGYVWAGLNRMQKKVPPDFVRFLRQEQIGRLRSYAGLKGGAAS